MTDATPQRPWGPYGPPADEPETSAKRAASSAPAPGADEPSVPPTAPAWETTPEARAPASPVSGWGRKGGFLAHQPFAILLRNFGIGGAVLGVFYGIARALLDHLTGSAIALVIVRMALAGAAAGASIAAGIRALSTLVRAAGWILLTLALVWLALVLAGRTDWLGAVIPARR